MSVFLWGINVRFTKTTFMKLQIDRSALDAALTCRACRKTVQNTARKMFLWVVSFHLSFCIQLFTQLEISEVLPQNCWVFWIPPMAGSKKEQVGSQRGEVKNKYFWGQIMHVHLRLRRECRHLHFLSSPLWLQKDGCRGRLAFS